MPKIKISEFDSTPANNTDIDGINIAEGCAPSGINNAIRELMSQLKDQQTGAAGDNFTVGGNLAVTGTATFTGIPSGPTASAGTNTTQLATTAHVFAERTNTATLTNKTLTSPTISGGSITGITDLAVADGGTGASTLAANNVLLGNGTSALQTVAPSTSGNFLRSNGTTWISEAVTVAAGTVTSVATGNGLSGGTITSSGTLSLACPTFNTVGSYSIWFNVPQPRTSGSNYSGVITADTDVVGDVVQVNLSGTWKFMGGTLICRVS